MKHAFINNALISGVRFYRRNFSSPSMPKCRFIPTCSLYALESLEKYGAFKGSRLALGRFFKCHPFHKGGYDPVP